ncbi:MAG: hypothetical protein V4535_09480 [Bacteroidota bacterium]
MENRKDIGKAINDKLNSLDKSPKEQVWVGINEELQKKKKRRVAFYFFWTKVIGLLLIGTFATFYVYQNDGFDSDATTKSKESTIVNGNNTTGDHGNLTKDDSDIENPEANDRKANTNNEIPVEAESTSESKNRSSNSNGISIDKKSGNKTENLLTNKNKKASAKVTRKNSGYSSSKSEKSKLYSKAAKKKSAKKSKGKSEKEKNDLTLTEINSGKKDTMLIDLTSLQGKKSDEIISEAKSKKKDSLASKKEKDLTKHINMYPKEKKDSLPVLSYRKFDFDVFISPTYYGFISKGSTIDRRLDSLPKKAEMKFSYGVGLTYGLSDKLSVRIGYSKVILSYVTKNAPIGTSNYNGIDYKPNISNETIFAAHNAIVTEVVFPANMDVTQNISYTEIPLEVKYKFLDKKFSLKSALGVSYLFLNENSVSIKTTNGFRQDIGKTKGLSKTSLSVNLGAEADYPLFKNMKIFVQPTFNYQINASSNSNFKPYYFGIHTGIRYSFNN